jgi:hypothetical protein
LRVGVEVPSKAWAKENLVGQMRRVSLVRIDDALNVIGELLTVQVTE